MIYISEEKTETGAIVIKVDGLLNRKTVDPLSQLISKHLGENLSILLDLAGVTHTDEMGKAFLASVRVRNDIYFRNTPTFLKMILT